MIDLVNVSLQFGGKYLFKDVNYKISSGDKISLVGANGTGKSSLLKIIAGFFRPESGTCPQIRAKPLRPACGR